MHRTISQGRFLTSVMPNGLLAVSAIWCEEGEMVSGVSGEEGTDRLDV